MSKAIAVLCSDVHYSLPNLKLADTSMRMAIAEANELDVPLIVAGDLHDTKANLRGECVTAMIKTFTKLQTKCPILLGNHDLINEKSKEHSLEFLRLVAGVYLIEKPLKWDSLYLIPYHSDPDELRVLLKTIPKGFTLIMHQGLTSSNSGDYIQDKSAISPEDVSGYRVVSGHYHTRQTIELPGGGSWSYIGNPYTLTYGEASDPEKGFQILHEDGSLEFVPTNLRRHVKATLHIDEKGLHDGTPLFHSTHPDDLIWITVEGPDELMMNVTKETVAKYLDIKGSFKLDLKPLDTKSQVRTPKDLTDAELLDKTIADLNNTSDERKARLKELWRNLGA